MQPVVELVHVELVIVFDSDLQERWRADNLCNLLEHVRGEQALAVIGAPDDHQYWPAPTVLLEAIHESIDLGKAAELLQRVVLLQLGQLRGDVLIHCGRQLLLLELVGVPLSLRMARAELRRELHERVVRQLLLVVDAVEPRHAGRVVLPRLVVRGTVERACFHDGDIPQAVQSDFGRLASSGGRADALGNVHPRLHVAEAPNSWPKWCALKASIGCKPSLWTVTVTSGMLRGGQARESEA